MSHPVRLVVADDLQRSRATVFFRLLLALPHLFVLVLWALLVYVVTIANWVVALVRGSLYPGAHEFSAHFVRYAVQVGAYLSLLANPYPAFGGKEGYPVDVAIAPAAEQNRWATLFRIVLALPAVVLGALLTNGFYESRTREAFSQVGGLLGTVAVLGWFAALALASMPRGLRDAGAYGLSYGAQVHAYLLLLTDRYPNSDPLAALDDLPGDGDQPVRLTVDDDRRRSRVTVFFRLLLAIPHFIWLFLWGIAALFATIANWFVVLFSGRSPDGLHGFLADYLRYATHVYAYVYLTADPYPPFEGRSGDYPVDLEVAGPQRQNRWKTFFRLPLALPALAVTSAYSGVGFAAAVFGWFVSLFRAEMPLGLRNAQALALRYNQQLYAYLMLLTDRYPYTGPTIAAPAVAPPPRTFLPPDAQSAQDAFGS